MLGHSCAHFLSFIYVRLAAVLGGFIILVLILIFILIFILILVTNQLFPGLPQPSQEQQEEEVLLQGGNIQVTVLPSSPSSFLL